jgi:cytochrome c oxidase subunit 2
MAFIERLMTGSRSLVAGIFVWIGSAVCALADGGAKDWQIGFQPAASPTADEIHWFNNHILLPVIIFIVVFVMALLAWVMWRYSSTRNPTPSKTTHNTTIEVLWTAVPVMILIVIAIPSFKLLYFADRVEDGDITLKATGRQWYWSYQYPDYGDLEFDATLVPEEDLQPGQKRLLTTDNPVVLPVGTNIRLLVTASDVLHSFALPAMGIKLDAVPGRVNETWMRIEEEGTYYGQCSELCGSGHAFMPIMVKAVSKPDFEAWIEKAKQEFAARDSAKDGLRVAAADAAARATATPAVTSGN